MILQLRTVCLKSHVVFCTSTFYMLHVEMSHDLGTFQTNP